MSIEKDQLIHELAMACVNGMVTARVLQESKDDESNIGISYDSADLALDALIAYKKAVNIITLDLDEDD